MKKWRILFLFFILTLPFYIFSAELFSDTFTGVDGSRPFNWNFFGDAKEAWIIRKGELYGGNGDIIGFHKTLYAIVNVKNAKYWTDYQIEVDIWNKQQNGVVYLVARFQDPNNCYRLAYESYLGEIYFRIEKVKNGKLRVLAIIKNGANGVAIPDITNGTNYYDSAHFVFRVKGNKLYGSINNQCEIEATDSDFAMGPPGLGQHAYEPYFDNFVVKDLRGIATSTEVSTATPSYDYFTIRLAQGLSQTEAEHRKQELEDLGFIPTEIIPDNGQYILVTGKFLSRIEAQRQLNNLEKEGFIGGEIIKLSEAKLSEKQKKAFTFKPKKVSKYTTVYKILLGEFDNEQDAIDLKASVEVAGYYPVSIVQEGNKWKVYLGGYNSKSLAEEVKNSLEKDGYIGVSVEKVKQRKRILTQEEKVAQEKAVSKIKAELEKAKASGNDVLYIQQLERLLQYSLEQEQVIKELKRAVSRLDKEQKMRLLEEKKKEEQKKLLKQKVQRMHQEAFRLLDQGKPREAIKIWEDILKIDDSGRYVMYINIAKEKLKEMEQKKKEEEEKKKIQALVQKHLKKGTEYLNKGDYKRAEYEFLEVKRLDPNNIQAEQALQQIIAKTSESSSMSFLKGTGLLIFLLFVFIILIFVIVVFLIFKYRQIMKRDRELLEQVQQLTYNPPVTEMSSDLPGNSPSTPKIESKPEVKSQPEPSSFTPTPEFATESKPSPTQAKTQKSPELKESQTVEQVAEKVKEKKEETKAQPEQVVSPQPEIKEVPQPQPQVEETFSISPEIETEKKSEPPLTEDISLSIEPEGEVPEVNVGPSFDLSAEETKIEPTFTGNELETSSQPQTKETESSKVAQKSVEELQRIFSTNEKIQSSTDSVLFKQDFDSEKTGNKPEGWVGEYDYASLTIVEGINTLSGSKCCKYEKKEPKGTAYFYREIPPLKGKFAIEFDLKCDQKNKYLLGLYLEKDRDFRQSIHTLLYTVDPANPSIRLHGEPAPYKMGEWKRIKYEIDLTKGVVNGYIDGNLILKDCVLTQKLEYINTISIRDNLGTVGVLYLDNIVAYKL